MKFYTQDQMVDKHVGVKGSAARAEYDEQLLEIPAIGRVALC